LSEQLGQFSQVFVQLSSQFGKSGQGSNDRVLAMRGRGFAVKEDNK
jgi:hypothetical protein